MTGQWPLGLSVGLLVVHTLVTYGVYRLLKRAGATESATEGGAADLIDTEDGRVQCPECGVENELGYRYCRTCVSELPGTMNFRRGSDSPLGRLTR